MAAYPTHLRLPTPSAPLSPELALVSPELARAARALLPERPWEAFAPPRPLLRLARPPAPARAQPAPSRRRRRAAVWPAVALIAFAALIGAGFLPARDAPTLETGAPALAVAGAYALDGGGELLVSPDGRSVARLALLRCLPGGIALAAPIAQDGSFAVVRVAPARHGQLTVHVGGRFTPDGVVRGVAQVHAPGCAVGRVGFTGHR